MRKRLDELSKELQLDMDIRIIHIFSTCAGVEWALIMVNEYPYLMTEADF